MKGFFLVSLVLSLSLLSPTLFAEETHQHTSHAPTTLQLNSGKKWETDAPLRKGMTGIQEVVAAKLDLIHNNKLTTSQYTELAKKISVHTDSIFKNCKLAPEADAQLHIVLAQVLDGTHRMKSADNLDGRKLGAVKIVEALQLYPKYFDHPGWKPLKH